MGLIKALGGAVGGLLADQWREYFYCESQSSDILVSKGAKRTSKERSSNVHGSNDNIISNGSIIAVNEGQCMIIVEQGKVVDVCAEPGEFTYDTSSEPSLFYGPLGENIKKTFSTLGKRFTFGGDTAKDQRIYYFNTKEIMGNKYGTATPIPFRIVDNNIGLDMDIAVRCNGEYSYKLTDPMLFYTNVSGNVETEFNRSQIDSMLKTEFLTALQPAFAKISALGIRYSAIPGHTMELADALNEVLSAKWLGLRGIAVASIGVNSISASPEDEETIKRLQKVAVMRDPSMAAANLIDAQSDALKAAAANESGAMMGFLGLGLAHQASGTNTQSQAIIGQHTQQPTANQPPKPQGGWACPCGHTGNEGKFCMECGKPAPAPAQEGWICACGVVNKGKFCPECGKPKPAEALLYRCDKCGWEPSDPKNPPKFCPECGDIFDESDAKR